MKMFGMITGRLLIASVAFTTTLAAFGSVASGQSINTIGDSAGFHLSETHAFRGGSDGSTPSAGLLLANDGNFYGTTSAGGAANAGTVFKMTPAGIVTVLYAFTGGADGGSPLGALIQATGGNLYGTTYSGGAANKGTVFSVSLSGAFSSIYSFTDNPDGANPRAALIQATDGNLYGTTQFGGQRGRGTVFGMTPAGAVTLRYSFEGSVDAAYPYAPLIQGTDGNLYGTAYAGDVATFGRVFKMTLGGTVTILHTFLSGSDGASPLSALVQANDGNFYGTTHLGGSSNLGTLFKMTPDGTVTIIKSFTGGDEGANPDAALIQAADGKLYGTTRVGAGGHGTAFQLLLPSVFTVIHTFSGGGDGADSSAPLIQAANGDFYGTTNFGGGSTLGNVFRLSNAAAPAFTDNVLTPGTTPIRAVHITELRSRIDAVRVRFGLAPYSYTDPTLTVGATVIKAAHITELRTALTEAYNAAALSAPNYTDTTLAGALIKATHIAELRAAVVDIE